MPRLKLPAGPGRPKSGRPPAPARDLLTVEIDPDTRAALTELVDREAARSGGNPRRLQATVVRAAIRAARRAAD